MISEKNSKIINMLKLNKMKKTMILVASIIMFATACEKENTSPISTNKNINVKSDNKHLKSEEEFDENFLDDIEEFILTIVDEEEFDSNMELKKALYYTETTLDWRLTGRLDDKVERRESGTQFEYNITASKNNEDVLELTSTQIINLNSDIYDDIANEAGDLSDSTSMDISVDIIDLEWEINEGTGGVIVFASGLYNIINNDLINPSLQCVLNEAKVGLRQKCDGTPYVHTAAEEIDSYTGPLCGNWNNKLSCNLKNSVVLNPRVSSYNGLTPCGSYVYGGPNGVCRTAAQNQSEFEDTRDVWNNQCMTFPGNLLRTVFYQGRYYPIPNHTANHFVNVYTVSACKKICDYPLGCPTSERPRPIF